MKKLALAAAVALSPSFAEAQQTCLTRDALEEQWNNIPTSKVFNGLSDQGVAIAIFENTDNGRWSFWFTRPQTPDLVCLFDQGSAANSEHVEFTNPNPAP